MNLDKEVVKRVGAGLLIAVLSWSASWVFQTASRVAVVEQRVEQTAKLAVSNQETLSNIGNQINLYNQELVKLIGKQDVRITKVETMLEIYFGEAMPDVVVPTN